MMEIPVVLLVALSPFTIVGFLVFIAVIHVLCEFSSA